MATAEDSQATPGQPDFLGLGELVAQLVEQAQEARRTQARLLGLLDANRSIAQTRDLATVLRRIVEVALDLVDAEYGALGVVDRGGGGLEEFVYVGMDEDDVRRIGHLPEGRGMLGALIDDPRTIRLEHRTDDARSVSLPEGHPPMDSFLGVPLRIRDETFGNLYLTNALAGSFDEQDEAVVAALAATASVAIENARLFESERRRQEWLTAAAEVTRRILTVNRNNATTTIVETMLPLADADVVTVLVPDEGRTQLVVVAAAGAQAERLTSERLAYEGTATQEVLRSGSPMLVGDAALREVQGPYPPHTMSLGPAMILPLTDSRDVRGVLIAARSRGRRQFDDVDLEMGTRFASYASLALEVADARIAQQRMAVLEDRMRIAHDLHDHAIQQLFAAGMTLQGIDLGIDDPSRQVLDRVVDALDSAIKQIRTSIFQLRPHHHTGTSLRSSVLSIVAEVAPALGFEAAVEFDGPIDAVTDEDLAADVLAVVREGLSNTAKHAQASRATVRVEASSSRLRVSVEDDGVGLGAAGRRSGLDNLEQRAELRGGTFDASLNGDRHGLILSWSAPLS